MICTPCRDAADVSAADVRQGGLPTGHAPAICRDHGRPGCPCQHRPTTTQNGTDQ